MDIFGLLKVSVKRMKRIDQERNLRVFLSSENAVILSNKRPSHSSKDSICVLMN